MGAGRRNESMAGCLFCGITSADSVHPVYTGPENCIPGYCNFRHAVADSSRTFRAVCHSGRGGEMVQEKKTALGFDSRTKEEYNH